MDNQYQVIPSSARVRTAGLPEATAGKRYPKNRDYFFGKEFELSLIQTAMDELGITRRGIASWAVFQTYDQRKELYWFGGSFGRSYSSNTRSVIAHDRKSFGFVSGWIQSSMKISGRINGIRSCIVSAYSPSAAQVRMMQQGSPFSIRYNPHIYAWSSPLGWMIYSFPMTTEPSFVFLCCLSMK